MYASQKGIIYEILDEIQSAIDFSYEIDFFILNEKKYKNKLANFLFGYNIKFSPNVENYEIKLK